ncbi:MAG: pitrilysin family protein [bacterium]|nr:pitrilysin family protein [bacterium]
MSMKLASLTLLIALFSVAALAQSTGFDGVTAQANLVTEFDVNGLKVIYKRRPNSATVSSGLFIRGGARNITAKNAGIEALMLATAVEAGKNIPRQTVRRELAGRGSSNNSGASNDYSVIGIATTKPDFPRVFEIFSDLVLNPAFAEDDIKRNKDIRLASLREAGSVPEAALETMSGRVIYSGHPYANEVNGTPASIAAITAADLRAYHKQMMETSRLLFVIVGDLDAGELTKQLTATFGKLPKGTYKDAAYPAIDFSKGTLDVTQRALPTNYVKGVFAAPSIGNPDYYAMRVAMSILQTLVYQKVRGELQLSYAPDADMDSFAANTANISVSTTDPNRAVTAMVDQIKFLQERQLNSAVIDEIASFFLTRHYIGQETSTAQVAELAKYELIGGGWRNSFQFLNGVRSVKPDDIRMVANKYMKNIRYVYIGDPTVFNRESFVTD